MLPELYEDLVVQVVTDLSKSLEVEILSSAFNQVYNQRNIGRTVVCVYVYSWVECVWIEIYVS